MVCGRGEGVDPAPLSTNKYCHLLIQYHQVTKLFFLAKFKISQYIWSSFCNPYIKSLQVEFGCDDVFYFKGRKWFVDEVRLENLSLVAKAC